MIANYHTHTWRCNHAQGREEEYVLAAIDRGFQILGFADHTPQIFSNGYVSGYRMAPEQLGDYCATIRALQHQYADQLQIPLGLEAEYYPAVLGELLPFLRDHGIEYLILGQHFTGNEYDGVYVGRPVGEDVLKQYCRQTMEAMNTGLYTYLAHPDVIRFVGEDRVYREQMRLLAREAKNCGMPVEMNVLGQWSQRNYPDRRFWEIAAEEGCTAVIGWDIHAPEQFRKVEAGAYLTQMAGELGIPVLDEIPFRSI